LPSAEQAPATDARTEAERAADTLLAEKQAPARLQSSNL